MSTKNIELNESWMSGVYRSGEVNVSFSWVDVPNVGDGWFLQGNEADNAIKEMHEYWINNDCSTAEAFEWWVNTYLY